MRTRRESTRIQVFSDETFDVVVLRNFGFVTNRAMQAISGKLLFHPRQACRDLLFVYF